MTPGEVYNLKRKNFINKTQKNFEFLVSEFGFSNPGHVINKLPNGAITRDSFEYKRADKTIIILNAYHPVDYGFEINLTEKETGRTEMLHSILKEKQDIEQSYLESASDFLRDGYRQRLTSK